jgi:hypothetical protein
MTQLHSSVIPLLALLFVFEPSLLCHHASAFTLESQTPVKALFQRHLSSLPSSSSHLFSNKGEDTTASTEGIFRPFMAYAWDKLQSSGLIEVDAQSNENNDIIKNSSPSKGSPDGTIVNVEIKSLNGKEGGSLRLGRYALLETLTPFSASTTSTIGDSDSSDDATSESAMISYNKGIHVLNLVLFPTISDQLMLPLPVLGMDLVTLPGGKHLIAIDFQPILPNDPDLEQEEQQVRTIFPTDGKYKKYEEQIKNLHQTHVLNQSDVVPWGGDIPSAASRFFSPYALWTRLKDEKGLDIVRNEVYVAFCAYFDLYMEILLDVQRDLELLSDDNNDNDNDTTHIETGHRDYLTYRKENDPARPMLTRLYGNEWTESVISEILFKMI